MLLKGHETVAIATGSFTTSERSESGGFRYCVVHVRAMKAYGWSNVKLRSFLTSALDGGD
jgi:hypothetical protein